MCHCPLCNNQQTVTYFIDSDGRDYKFCNICALIFLNPFFHLSKIDEKKRYDLHKNIIDDPHYLSFLKRLTDPLLKYLEPEMKGLDFGCGRVKAIESLLRKEAVSCVSYDPYYYPDNCLLTDSYDFITLSEVIEHIYQPRQIFDRLWDILLTDGVLAIMTSLYDGYEFSKWWYKNDPTHVCFYSQNTFQWVANQLNSELVINKNTIFLIKNN